MESNHDITSQLYIASHLHVSRLSALIEGISPAPPQVTSSF